MNKLSKRIISVTLSSAVAVSALCFACTADAAENGEVRLVVRNDTYSVSMGAAWDGVLFDQTVSISDNGDALSTAIDAVGDKLSVKVNDTQWGSYISEINSVSEGDAAAYSGWMGMRNDWVVNNNLAYISLRDGDTLELVYSVNIGADIGADWNNPTTELKDLKIDDLAFNEVFSSANTDYTITVGDAANSVFVVPTAANKNYQVRSYLNAYSPDEYGYRATDAMDVKAGDTIYIGVGNAAWEGSFPAETVYRVHVMENDAETGDVNFDGQVDITDATLIQKASIDLERFSVLQNLLGDYNNDGRVSVLDTTAIQHMIAKA